MKPDLKKIIGIISVSIFILIIGVFLLKKDYKNNNELIIKYKDPNEIKLLTFKNFFELEKNKKILQSDKNIEFISKNNKYKITYLPNDPELGSQNYLKQINADLAWTFSHDAPNVTIAVIDSGIDLNHPDLKNNIWKNKNEIPNDGVDNDGNGYIDDVYGWDFVNNVSDSGVKLSVGYKKYAVNHGTVVAGIIGAVGDNNEGISGIAWNTKIMSLRAIDSTGEGNTYNIARAIDYAIKNGADVINLSFVGNENDPILADAIRRASKANIAVVAAAGNEINPGIDLDLVPRYPVCYDFNENTVFGVGSVDNKNVLSYFSNFGSNCVDIMAPGENFKSTQVYYPQLFDFKDKYGGGYSGTSVSAPLVSGTIALIKSIDPNFTIQEIYKIIQDSATNISLRNFDKRKQIGAGLLNVNNALIKARKLSSSRARLILTMPQVSTNYTVKIFDQKNNSSKEINLKARGVNGFKNYYNIKSGDVNGDKKQEIIISSTNSSGTYINTYDQNFKNINSFRLNFTSPVSIDIADIYKTGREKIIISTPVAYEPKIYIYEANGKLLTNFKAYTKNVKTGMSIAVCDVDRDYQDEIITVPKKGGGPHVLMYSKNGEIKGQFFAGNKDFKGGLNIACEDINNDKKSEIIITPQSQNMPYVLIYDINGNLLSSFMAYDKNFKGEININVSDTDFDYQNEIITSTGNGNVPYVKIFDSYGDLKKEFFAYSEKLKTGVTLTTLQKDAENN